MSINLTANTAKLLVEIMNEYNIDITVMAAIRRVILEDVEAQYVREAVEEVVWKDRAERAEAAINQVLSSTYPVEPFHYKVLSKGLGY